MLRGDGIRQYVNKLARREWFQFRQAVAHSFDSGVSNIDHGFRNGLTLNVTITALAFGSFR
jgi:hypothetical protein